MNQYREGKVKRTPARGVKEYLKPYAYKQWEGYALASGLLRATERPIRTRFRYGSAPLRLNLATQK